MSVRLPLLILALMMPFVADAVEAIVTWNAPTQYTNGEPLPPEHIVSYEVVHDSGVVQVVTGLTASFEVDPGMNCFIVRTLATNNLYSIYALVCKDIPGDGPPGEPVLVCP